jgi:hypothetical protein
MRTQHGSRVTIKDGRTGYQYPASMYKCGKSRMYIESNYAPRPGSIFQVILENRELNAEAFAFPAVIQWRKVLCRLGSPYSYSLGIKYV